MSHTPNQSTSHARSPSVESTTSNQHQRRVSTHSLGISYAYGAPSPQQPGTSNTSPRSKRTNRKPSEEPLVRPRQQRELSVEETGRAIEPAAVRYSRLQAQRKQQPETSGGGTTSSNSNFNKMASLNNTSVNIATAFKAATSGNRPAMVKAGRREDFPPLEERSENRENDERREEGSSKQAIPEGVDGSASKKRKKNGIKDPSFRPSQREGETESSEEYSEEHESTNGKKGKKRAKVRSEDEQGLADDPSVANSKASPRKPRRSHKPADPSYKPSADPSFHPNNTSSDPDSDEDDEGRRRRSRSKSGKGGIGVDAIPRGIRDGEVWYGKGKKKRASRGGKSSGNPSSSRRRSGESVETEKAGDREEEEEEDSHRDLGGMEPQDHDYGTPDPEAQEEDEEEDEQQTPPAHAGNQSGGLVSYFLRRKSPSPGTNAPPPEENGASSTSTRKGFSFPSLSPFRNRSHDPSPDPAFAAFDRSLHASSHSQSHSQDSLQSIDELSHLRNSSYDYSEEEKMVQIAEEQYRRNKSKQQTSSQPQFTPAATSVPARLFTSNQKRVQTPGTPVGMTPAPKSGAYPLTPGSPVNALQRNRANGGGGGKNRLPAPPSMLGQQASSGSRMERDEGEGVWGRRCGSAVRPVVEMVGRFRRKLQDPLLDWGKILKALGGALGVVTLLLAIRYADSTSNRLPHFSSHSSPSTYSPPSTPPDSIDALVSRLSSLESAVGKLSTSTDLDRSTAKQDRSLLERVTDQIQRLERNLEEEQTGVRREFDQLEKERSKDARQVEGSVKDVKEDLGSLIRRVQELSAARETDSTRLDSLETGVDSTTKELETLSAQLGKLSKEVESGLKSERITQLAIAAIEKKLPGKIGVRLDSSGRLEIDPTFWKYLKEAFVDRKEVEKTVDNKLKAFEKRSASSGGGGLFGSKDKDKKDSQVVVAQQPPSWDDFLSSNEESIRTWIASDLEGRVGGDAFVSKKTFLDLLQREIKLLKRDFESKANENFEQMGQELLSKVAKQEEMRKKDFAYAQHHQQRQSGSSSASINGPVTIKSLDGQNVTAVISSLVDSALLRYSKDVLARPDYALFTSGGRVIRSLTSQTYEPHPLSRSRAALSWITGASAPRGRPAVTALHPDTAPGSCWPFEGQRGQIGIQLSRRVVPSDITIEHISRDVALDGDVSSAPKDFEVWAVVEGQEHVVKLAQYRQQEIETKRSAQSSTSLEDALNNEEPASLPPTPNHLLLAIGTYDPLAISPIQTFPVTPMARQLGIPVQIVVVKILSNQGESAYTCLYRVRISGSTEAQLVNSPI